MGLTGIYTCILYSFIYAIYIFSQRIRWKLFDVLAVLVILRILRIGMSRYCLSDPTQLASPVYQPLNIYIF